MDYNLGLAACFIVSLSSAQDVCQVFGETVESSYRQFNGSWSYVYTVVHIHGQDVLNEAVYDAVTHSNEVFSSSQIQLSLVDVLHHDLTLDTNVCFPYDYAAMEEYISPLQYPTEHYMNIHVFPEFCGSILGFAFLWYQQGQDADGVYVRTDCFGRIGNLLPDRNLNATLIHELGHYFSLFHVFQGIDYCGESEEDCTQVNDRVCDTPPTKLNWSCENPICPPGAYNYTPDNYMDYYVDSCKTTFTMGQRSRMQTVLPQWRPELIQEEPYCSGDINNDMSVDVLDLLLMFTCYGTSGNTQVDINKDGIVSVADLTTLLSQWSVAC
jgi:hypothetical protein